MLNTRHITARRRIARRRGIVQGDEEKVARLVVLVTFDILLKGC